MMTSEDVEILNAMHRFGGGFVKALASAAGRADDYNLLRLEDAFPEIWTQKARA